MNNIRNSSINVLLIEDNPGDARLVQEFLHEEVSPILKRHENLPSFEPRIEV